MKFLQELVGFVGRCIVILLSVFVVVSMVFAMWLCIMGFPADASMVVNLTIGSFVIPTVAFCLYKSWKWLHD